MQGLDLSNFDKEIVQQVGVTESVITQETERIIIDKTDIFENFGFGTTDK